MESVCCLVVEKKNVKKAKVALESYNMLHKKFRITRIKSGNDDLMAVPITFHDVTKTLNTVENHTQNITEISELPSVFNGMGTVQFINKDQLSKSKIVSPQERLMEYCSTYMGQIDDPAEKVNRIAEIPSKWELHGDLVMFSDQWFCSAFWKSLQNDRNFWKGVADVLGVKRVALSSRIVNDDYRTPSVEIKYDETSQGGWVEHVDNGIKYAYDVTKNMFSKGNITEKLRISEWDCRDEIVVDLFAGIGYFVLPYLLKARAKMVYACEWNPDAVFALKRTLEVNNIPSDRYKILLGDNREVAPRNVADRVNLGLVPTSSASWLTGCKALKTKLGGWLHIHENIDSGPNSYRNCACVGLCIIRQKYKESVSSDKAMVWCTFIARVVKTLTEYFQSFSCELWTIQLEHVEHVKSYAPRVDHVVLDLLCKPTAALHDDDG